MILYNSSSSTENIFQDPQWIPEIADSTKSYLYCFFLYTYIHDKV